MDAPTPTNAVIPRQRALEAGLFLLLVALPLVVFPLSRRPFLDAKPLILAGGTLLVLVSGTPADRRIGRPALAWALVLLIAAIAGVDRVESLIGSVRATGLAMLLCAAALVAVAPNVPLPLLERARAWLVGAGLTVATVMVLARVAPVLLEPVGHGLGFGGSTLGNPVHATGFLAICIPAALATRRGRWPAQLSIFALLGAGFAVAQERSAWLLPVAAILASSWLIRPGWRRVGLAAGTMATVVLLWISVPVLADRGSPSGSFSTAGQFQTLKGERQRIALYGASARAIAQRPVLGWGPANTWSGFLSSGTPEQVDRAGRNWADSHDLFLELAVVSGLLGLSVFVWLLLRIAPRALRPAPGRGWLAAAALTLGVYAMYEPLDIVLTPLLLLLAGAAAGGREEPVCDPVTPPVRAIRFAAAAGLAGLVGLTAANISASALEEWGHTHYGADWALRTALDIAPWRLTASETLATNLAIEARGGDRMAETEAREVVLLAVERHPMNPGVRLLAADVELLLRNFPGTQAWIREQLRVFPSDTVEIPAVEPGISLPG